MSIINLEITLYEFKCSICYRNIYVTIRYVALLLLKYNLKRHRIPIPVLSNFLIVCDKGFYFPSFLFRLSLIVQYLSHIVTIFILIICGIIEFWITLYWISKMSMALVFNLDWIKILSFSGIRLLSSVWNDIIFT